LAHSQSFLANQKARNAVVGAETLLKRIISQLSISGNTSLKVKNSIAEVTTLNVLRRISPEASVTSGKKLCTKFIYIVLKASLRLF